MMNTYPTNFLLFFIFYFFSSLFSQPPTIPSHSHQISFLFLHSPSCLFYNSSFSPKTKDSSSCSPKRQEERDTLHSKWEKKKPQQKRKKLVVEEEEARNSSGFMGLCWNWKLHIWFRILQSVWLVRIWRKGKERRIWGKEERNLREKRD